MIHLQRHIEILLLENECVIVPDFGGFMTHELTARYNEADCLFLPPSRTLGFNPQLRINDSLLVQSYVETYDISYPEALRRVEQEVKELKDVLSRDGSYELNNLGTLTVNHEGNYQFEPCESGVLSPTLYGLSDFDFTQLKDKREAVTFAPQNVPVVSVVESPKQQPIAASETTESKEETTLLDFSNDDSKSANEKTINIKMSWIRNAVAVAAAIVAFFLVVTPINNSNLSTQAMSQIQHTLLYKLIPQDTNNVTATPDSVAISEVASTSHTKPAGTSNNESVETEKPIAAEIKTGKITYFIIVASQVKKSNADLFVSKLQSEGYKDARVWENNNVVRVVCGEFDTQEEAYRQLNKMNTKEEFYEAWVYKHKA